MKRAIALILSLALLLPCFATAAVALEDPGLIGMIEEEEPLLYYIVYQKETLSGISMMYKPNPSLSLTGPGYVTVTSDEPLAVDHDFVCWEDGKGNRYYAGDKIFVDGEFTLYAVWVEKDDNLIRPIRVLRCAMLTMAKMFAKAFGIFKDIQDFTEDRVEGMRRAVAAYNEAVNATKAVQNVKIDKSAISAYSCIGASPVGAKDTVKELLNDKFAYSYTESHTIKNGVDESGKSANDYIRPYGKASEVQALGSYITSGSVTENEDGSKHIVLVLFKEDSYLEEHGTPVLPERHAQYMDPLDLSGDVFKSYDLDYAKVTIRADTDSTGKLTSWSISAPITGSATVVAKSVIVEIEMEAAVIDNYTFTY